MSDPLEHFEEELRSYELLEEPGAPGTLIPLNLDYARPSLVASGLPWGWSLQPMAWVGVSTDITARGEFRLNRSSDGPPARAIYDLNSPFAGRHLRITGVLRSPAYATASVRIGLLVLGANQQTTEAWSPSSRNGPCAVAMDVRDDARNVHVALEYSGRGPGTTSCLAGQGPPMLTG